MKPTTHRLLIFLFLGAFLWFNIYLFPSYGAEMELIAGKTIEILDLKFKGYSVLDVQGLMTDLKKEGRVLYKEIAGFWDMIYPLVYGPLLMLLMFFFLKKMNVQNRNWFALLGLPLLAMGFDYLENFSTLYLLENYNTFTETDAQYGTMMTRGKWGFVFSSLLVVFILGGFSWKRSKP